MSLIFLGIFLGIISAGLSLLKNAGIKAINRFRIRIYLSNKAIGKIISPLDTMDFKV